MLTAFNHPIATLREGLNAIVEGAPEPMPLKETRFDIDVEKGLAIIRTTRVFTNDNSRAIEAILTFPVPFDGVLTGLNAEIDSRKLTAAAKAKSEAREDYEEAVSKGKMAVLHEEPLRGLHMLSIGQLAAGKTVSIETEMTIPLAVNGATLFLKLPLVVGEIYGTSPFLPSDDIKAVDGFDLKAMIKVNAEGGRVLFEDGKAVENAQTIALDRHLYLQFPDQHFGQRKGTDAWGREVTLSLTKPVIESNALDIAILVDRSGSTDSPLGRGTVHTAMRKGLKAIAADLSQDDLIALWEFESSPNFVGHTRGKDLTQLADHLSAPGGGTELGTAVETVMKHAPKPVLVLTDGQTYAHEVQTAQKAGFPIHAILVGEGSLDAMIGHLAAQTGGQVISAMKDDVAGALRAALSALRLSSKATSGHVEKAKPSRVETMRGGVALIAEWSSMKTENASDPVGRYAASLALSFMDNEAATSLAIGHGLTSHLTSLILVDEAGEAVEGLPQTVKVPVQMASMSYATVPMIEAAGFDMSLTTHLRQHPKRVRQQSISRLSALDFGASDEWSLVTLDHLDDIASLPDAIRLRVETLMQKSEIIALAQSLKLPTTTVALLLVALDDKDHDRNAGRFVRQARKVFRAAIITEIEQNIDIAL